MRIVELNFPCTSLCLIKPACSKPCKIYTEYYTEVYRSIKYKCFKLSPAPPLQLIQLSYLLHNHSSYKRPWSFSYFGKDDRLIVYYKDSIKVSCHIKNVRFMKDLFHHSLFEHIYKDIKKFLSKEQLTILNLYQKKDTTKQLKKIAYNSLISL